MLVDVRFNPYVRVVHHLTRRLPTYRQYPVPSVILCEVRGAQGSVTYRPSASVVSTTRTGRGISTGHRLPVMFTSLFLGIFSLTSPSLCIPIPPLLDVTYFHITTVTGLSSLSSTSSTGVSLDKGRLRTTSSGPPT